MSAADVPPAGRDLMGALRRSMERAQADRQAAAELRAAADHYDDLYHDETVTTELRGRADTLSAPSAPQGVLGDVPTGARGVTGRSRQGIGNDDEGDESP